METPYECILMTNVSLKRLAFVLIILIAACTHRTQKMNDTFVVPIINKPILDSVLNEPPPVPPVKTYYLAFNFLVDASGEIFYYQRQSYRWICGTGLDWDTPPPFIDLQPKDIIHIPDSNIQDFIKLNVFTVDSPDRTVSIALLKDTIRSIQLSKIIAVLKDTSNHATWLLRKATLEELVVFEHKRNQAYYDSNGIKWDSTRIGFAPNFEDMIKFTTPKVEEE